jgi:hypothetical protein
MWGWTAKGKREGGEVAGKVKRARQDRGFHAVSFAGGFRSPVSRSCQPPLGPVGPHESVQLAVFTPTGIAEGPVGGRGSGARGRVLSAGGSALHLSNANVRCGCYTASGAPRGRRHGPCRAPSSICICHRSRAGPFLGRWQHTLRRKLPTRNFLTQPHAAARRGAPTRSRPTAALPLSAYSSAARARESGCVTGTARPPSGTAPRAAGPRRRRQQPWQAALRARPARAP